MFVILVYDVDQKRVGRVLKICRKYLTHVQKSVFEGSITEAKFTSLKNELKKIIDCEYDGICIYTTTRPRAFMKEQIGIMEDHSHII